MAGLDKTCWLNKLGMSEKDDFPGDIHEDGIPFANVLSYSQLS